MNLKSIHFAELRKARALVKKIHGRKRLIEELPVAWQHYLAQSGFTNYPYLHQAEIHWKDTFLKFNKDGNWKAVTCSQHNFLPDPVRLVYMKTKLLGLFSLEAIDSFRHGRGNMHVKALGIFDVVNSNGMEMDKSELVTILAETMIIPDYALQAYIQWEEIEPYTVKGTIDYHGLKASGIFYFNHNFELMRFETNDRYLTNKDGSLLPVKWTAEATNYVKRDGLNFPSIFTATWNEERANYCYFKGEITSIKLIQ